MKNKSSLWLLIAIIAIGFIAVSCDDGSESSTATAPTITTAALPGGTVGTAYSQTLAATGDTPITWSIATGGTLPAGLSLAPSTGVISGTPTVAGKADFTVKAANAAGSKTKALSITIAAAGSNPDPNPSNCTSHNFQWIILTPAAYCTDTTHGTGSHQQQCQNANCTGTGETEYIPCLGTESLQFTTQGSGTTQTRRVSGITRTAIVCIPDFKDGYPVASIASSVFGNSNEANADTVLTSIRLSNNITSIADNAFRYCTNLESVVFPEDKLTSIGSLSFANTKLKEVIIPDSVTGTLNSSFRNNTALTKVVIGNNVTRITLAFTGCTNLSDVTIGSKVTQIDGDTFRDNTSLTEIELPDGLLRIGANAFRGCTKLESITIPNTVTQIWSFAFYGTGLKSITIPDSVLYFGNNSTDSITGDSGADAFSNCPDLTTVVIGSGLEKISNAAFRNNPKLVNVTLGANLKTIGHQAFDATAIESIVWPAGLTSIGGAAFRGTKLAEVILPEGVTIIDYNSTYSGGAFANCTLLTTVVLPSTMTSIGSQAFYNSTALVSLTVKAVTPPTLGGTSVFGSTPPAALVIKVLAESVETYKLTTNWSLANVASKIVAIE